MRVRVLWFLSMCLGLGLGAWSCGPTHCGYNGGDSACGGGTPFCDLCESENNGCVATMPSDAGCVLVTDGAATGVSSEPPVTVTMTIDDDPTTTQGPGSTPETTDDDPTNPPSTLETTDPSTTNVTTDPTTTNVTTDPSTTNITTDPSTSSSETTADDTTSGSTSGSTSTTSDDTTSGSSSTTSDDTTGPPPPMCGNDEVEGMEVCDGVDLDGKKCTDFAGKGGGTLACNPMCMFNLAGCCLANQQACQNNAQCCNNSCKFDLLMGKNICK